MTPSESEKYDGMMMILETQQQQDSQQINENDDKKIPMSCHQQQKQSLVFLFGNFLRVFMFRLFLSPFPARRIRLCSSHHPLATSTARKNSGRFVKTTHTTHFPTFDGMKSSPGNTHSKHIRLIKAIFLVEMVARAKGKSTTPEGSV